MEAYALAVYIDLASPDPPTFAQVSNSELIDVLILVRTAAPTHPLGLRLGLGLGFEAVFPWGAARSGGESLWPVRRNAPLHREMTREGKDFAI